MLIKNARPLIGGQFMPLCDIIIEGDKIKSILPCGSESSPNAYDADGNYCVAGYIDIHTHGGGGHDMMEATPEAMEAISAYHLSTGTTSYCPTTLTASVDSTIAAIDNAVSYTNTKTSRRLGVHLEGPFISLKAPGAHPPKYILDPSADSTQWVWENAEVIARVTLSPDSASAKYMTKTCADNNIQVSLGHDASVDDEINELLDLGASSVTHMFNCTSRPSRRTTPHKHLGLTEIGMIDPRLVCEIIADNRHVPNPLFGMAYKLKGASGICLVSDSLSVAGVSEGELFLGSGDSRQRLVVQDGVAILPALNTYAGSVTPIAEMVVNLTHNLNIPLNEAVSMGTLVPAALLNITDRGDIAAGLFADINIIANDGKIIATIFNGELLKR